MTPARSTTNSAQMTTDNHTFVIYWDRAAGGTAEEPMIFTDARANSLSAEALLAALPEPAALVDAAGAVMAANPALRQMLGGSVPSTIDGVVIGGLDLSEPSIHRAPHVLLDLPPGPAVHRAMVTVVDDNHRLIRIERRLTADTAVDAAEVDQLRAELATRREAEARLTEMVTTDDLTGLANRTALDRRLRQLLAAGHEPAVIYLDLDRFKAINDVYGHAAGDRALTVVAARLARMVRPDDLVGRRSGDEFSVIVRGLSADLVIDIAHRLCAELCRSFTIEGDYVDLGASVGVACHRPGDNAARLVARADAAMYRAKRRGGARVEVDDEPHPLDQLADGSSTNRR